MTFNEAIQALEKRGIMPTSAPDLNRMRKALDQVGYFHWPFYKKYGPKSDRVIVVAGTNGKGSTCAILEHLLRSAGERTGLYTSPHLVEYTERIRVNGVLVSEELFARSYKEIEALTRDLGLTHFEMLTLMALWVFTSGDAGPVVDRLILEVGLGGKWDATNAVPHQANVITSIGYDHLNLLGPTLKDILFNKLGIIQPDGLIFYRPFPQEVKEVALDFQNQVGGRWIKQIPFEFEGEEGHPPQFKIKSPWGIAPISVAGYRGAENTALALTVFHGLGFNPEKHLESLDNINWPGRMELIGKTPEGTPVYFSGDHNPQGIESLISMLKYYPHDEIYFVVGIGQEKDFRRILKPLREYPKAHIYLTETFFRSRKIGDFEEVGSLAEASLPLAQEAFQAAAHKAKKSDMIVITGSLYLAQFFLKPGALAIL